MSIPNYSLFYCCNDLIFFFKSLSDLYLINSRLLRDFFIKSNIIASSHPWFQADKRCVFYGPDSIAWESFRLNSHIRSSVFMTDPCFFNLRIIKESTHHFQKSSSVNGYVSSFSFISCSSSGSGAISFILIKQYFNSSFPGNFRI